MRVLKERVVNDIKLRTKIIIILSVLLVFLITMIVIVFGGLYLSYYISTADERKVEGNESEYRDFLFSQRPFLKNLPVNTITHKNFTSQEEQRCRKIIQKRPFESS